MSLGAFPAQTLEIRSTPYIFVRPAFYRQFYVSLYPKMMVYFFIVRLFSCSGNDTTCPTMANDLLLAVVAHVYSTFYCSKLTTHLGM